MIENHILERNKYWTKFPTLEMKAPDPEAGLRGVIEGTYPWARGHAPIPLVQDENCVWAHNRVERSTFSSGNPLIDAYREIYKEADDFRSATGPTLTNIATTPQTQYEGFNICFKKLYTTISVCC